MNVMHSLSIVQFSWGVIGALGVFTVWVCVQAWLECRRHDQSNISYKSE